MRVWVVDGFEGMFWWKLILMFNVGFYGIGFALILFFGVELGGGFFGFGGVSEQVFRCMGF